MRKRSEGTKAQVQMPEFLPCTKFFGENLLLQNINMKIQDKPIYKSFWKWRNPKILSNSLLCSYQKVFISDSFENKLDFGARIFSVDSHPLVNLPKDQKQSLVWYSLSYSEPYMQHLLEPSRFFRSDFLSMLRCMCKILPLKVNNKRWKMFLSIARDPLALLQKWKCNLSTALSNSGLVRSRSFREK